MWLDSLIRDDHGHPDGTRFLRPPLLDFEETAKLYDPQPSQPFSDAARSNEIEAEGVFCARHSHGRRTQVGSRSVDLAMIMTMRRISANRRFLWCAWFRRWSTLEKSTWRPPSPLNVMLPLVYCTWMVSEKCTVRKESTPLT